jgi:hypothetical protein
VLFREKFFAGAIEELPLGVKFFVGADGDADVLQKLFILNTAGTGGQLLP